ncbi:ParB/RepB/Spo0J family partition protein [Sphingomonas sp. Leaf25]|uniref:ParB/RepB/Spo0J family partition protein n=1 Tax=Sphingomonas sp. Leaf25 TaxID=1735692 RepID=UPI0006F7F2C5|nr:ParB N-terminal domain-containing protein [Sphingomonas sp. Leaf25]KQN00540.1 hypothetical protein ASE78_05490 [Sphingomonas sp. Leaf25]
MTATTARSRPTIVPSAPEIFPLRRLMRASENVRRIRHDEDVEEMAASLRSYGLLQSLIGYIDPSIDPEGRRGRPLVYIAGGGRRLQGLNTLMWDGDLSGDFPVPVLIRDRELAIELSLIENIQQRTMSPVDEVFAFRALVDTGHHTPEDLAKRFGISERVVRQRLRLAELDSEILDALADKRITLDSATAYAATQDRVLQKAIFEAQSKRSWDAHSVRNIRHAVDLKGMRTSHPVFRFVGADEYEARGGGYEDDLFRDDVGGVTRVLTDPLLLETIAAERIEAAMPAYLAGLRARDDLSPTIEGHVVVPGLTLMSFGHAGSLPLPPALVAVTRPEAAPLWRAIRDGDVPARVLVGIDGDGTLSMAPTTAIVAKGQRAALAATNAAVAVPTISEAQAAEMERVRGVLRHARRLAVHALGGEPLFAGTPLEGRVYWSDRPVYDEQIDGVWGSPVPVTIFITEAEIAAQRKAAEARYRDELAAIAAHAADRQARDEATDRRQAELREMDPPAVVAIDGDAWERGDDGSYAAASGDRDDFPGWDDLLDFFHVDEIGETFATRDSWLATIAGDDA